MRTLPAKQRGFGLIGTIFIVLACAIIGVYMTSLGASQSNSIGRSIEATRAYYAALAGLEWTIKQVNGSDVQHNAICSTAPLDPGGITTTFTLTEGALNGFQITIICDDLRPAGFTEGEENYELDKIEITAEKGGAPGDIDYVSRTIEGTIKGREI